jgi:hypothetical protein
VATAKARRKGQRRNSREKAQEAQKLTGPNPGCGDYRPKARIRISGFFKTFLSWTFFALFVPFRGYFLIAIFAFFRGYPV